MINIFWGDNYTFHLMLPFKKNPKSNSSFPQISLNRDEIAFPWKPRYSLHSLSITDFVAGKDDPRSHLISTCQITLSTMTATELSVLTYQYPRPKFNLNYTPTILRSKYIGDIKKCWPTKCQQYFEVSNDYFTAL